MMPIASCIPFPFSAPCDDMLTMLICVTHWLFVLTCLLTYPCMSLDG